MLRIPSVLLFAEQFILNGSFDVVLCRTWKSDASIDLNSAFEQSNAIALLSNLFDALDADLLGLTTLASTSAGPK